MLAHLVAVPANRVCENRRECAGDVLGVEYSKLHRGTAEVKIGFEAELKDCVATGMCPAVLFDFVQDIMI